MIIVGVDKCLHWSRSSSLPGGPLACGMAHHIHRGSHMYKPGGSSTCLLFVSTDLSTPLILDQYANPLPPVPLSILAGPESSGRDLSDCTHCKVRQIHGKAIGLLSCSRRTRQAARGLPRSVLRLLSLWQGLGASIRL